MQFQNRWIDPRVTQVGIYQLRGYLSRTGWREVEKLANGALARFENSTHVDVSLLVPNRMDGGVLLQRLIDLFADLSRCEDRWAGEILNDVLACPENLNLPHHTTPLTPAHGIQTAAS